MPHDDAMKEVLTRIDVDAPDDPLGEVAEIGREVEQQVDAGSEQKSAPQRSARPRSREEPGVSAEDLRHASKEPKHAGVSTPHTRALVPGH
jgi:hypothetical protein